MKQEEIDYGKIAYEAGTKSGWSSWNDAARAVISAYQAANTQTMRALTGSDIKASWLTTPREADNMFEDMAKNLNALLNPAAQAGDSPELAKFTKELEAKLASMNNEELMAALKRAGCEFEEQAGEVATGGPEGLLEPVEGKEPAGTDGEPEWEELPERSIIKGGDQTRRYSDRPWVTVDSLIIGARSETGWKLRRLVQPQSKASESTAKELPVQTQPPDTGGEEWEYSYGRDAAVKGWKRSECFVLTNSSGNWRPLPLVDGPENQFDAADAYRRRKVQPSASVEEMQKEIESLRELSASDTKHCNCVVAELDEYKAAFVPFTDRYGRPEITPLEAVKEMLTMFDRAKEEWDISDGRNAQLDRLCEKQREACRQLTKEKDELRSTLDKAKAELGERDELLQDMKKIGENDGNLLVATQKERDGLEAELEETKFSLASASNRKKWAEEMLQEKIAQLHALSWHPIRPGDPSSLPGMNDADRNQCVEFLSDTEAVTSSHYKTTNKSDRAWRPTNLPLPLPPKPEEDAWTEWKKSKGFFYGSGDASHKQAFLAGQQHGKEERA